MQSRKAVNNPEAPVFNIRKINKKITLPSKNTDNIFYSPETECDRGLQRMNFSQVAKGFDIRREKQIMLDQSVNEAILNSQVYKDLKQIHLENKRKNMEQKKQMMELIERKKKEKLEALQEQKNLENQRNKYIEAIRAMQQKIESVRETNQKYRQLLTNRMSGQTDYISNLIMSMRFQAEYEHDIDPDQMTYQQLLELEQKIGVVSRGLPPQLIQQLPKIEVKEASEQRCTVCFGNYEPGQVMTSIPNCKHEFHVQCLESWLGKEKVCPLCKQEVLFLQA